MIFETSSALQSAKEAFSLLKTIKEAREQSVIDRATGELYEKITQLQMLNSELASLYHTERQITMKLADENTKIKMFAAEASQYTRFKTDAGSIVYRHKPSADGEVSEHDLCANCYSNEKISILQPSGKMKEVRIGVAYHVYNCPGCNAIFLMDSVNKNSRSRRY